MKHLLLLLPILILLGCGGSPSGKFSSPDNTLNTLVTAIKAKDLAAYKECWHPDRLEREGMYSDLQADAGGWDELIQGFSGDLKLVQEGTRDEAGHEVRKFDVQGSSAPEGRGPGAITMINMDGQWLMWSW